MVLPEDGYEWAIGRITEMEVDLANAVSGLKRSQADNESLLANQQDLVAAYKRLQDHHDRLQRRLHQEQEEREQVADEQQNQIALWRSQLEMRDRDIEELQQHRMGPREVDAMHLQLAEEIEEPYRRQVHDLEGRLADEQQRAADALRQVELQRMEVKHAEQEARDQVAEQTQRQEVREQTLQRQISALEAEVRTQMDAAAGTWHLQMQVQEYEAKSLGLQNALQDQERMSSQERKALADEVLARSEELGVARRRMYELQLQLDTQERSNEQLVAEAQTLSSEKVRLSSQLSDMKAQSVTMKPAAEIDLLRDELDQLRRTAGVEREQLLKRAIGAEDSLKASQTLSKQAEVKARQLEEERTERDRDCQSEREEAERTHSLDLAKLQVEVDKSAREAETRRLAFREKERELTRQLETSSAQAEAFREDLEHSQLSQEDLERRLQEVRRDAQQRMSSTLEGQQKLISAKETELATLRERAHVLEKERDEHATVAESARAGSQLQEHRAIALQAELTLLSQRLDTERSQWVREADEVHAASLRAEEERRSTATNQLVEDQKRRMLKLNVAYKKALKKATGKRQEYKQRCVDLLKRITQLQQEKATAVRVCEENKAAFEVRLGELGLASRLGIGSSVGGVCGVDLGISHLAAGGAGVMNRRELRAIMERLEQNAERLHISTAEPVISTG